MAEKHPHVTTVADAEERIERKGTKFGFKAKRLGLAAGAKNLGCTWFEVEPGRTSFPRHFHCLNEEAIFVLEGQGRARLGDKEIPVGPGSYVAMPPGPDHAHSMTNVGTGPLRYLCFSTLVPTDVVGYPDSKKIAAFAGDDASRGLRTAKWVRLLVREQESVDYYDGEITD